MIRRISPQIFKYLTLAAGIAAFLLRFALLETGADDKGLLVSGHWADTAVWLLSAAVIGSTLLFTRKISAAKVSETASPASALRCVGSLVAACGILLSGTGVAATVPIAAAEPVLRILAAGALAALGYCHLQGRKPHFLLHGTVCLYLALRMVCRYQVWSAVPQLQHYAFYLGAHVALMLGSYQLAAFDADSGNHRKLWFQTLLGIYLCLAAIPGSEDPFFLLCCAIWMLTCLRCPVPVKGD